MFNFAQFFSRSNDFHPRSKRSSRRRRRTSFGQGLEHLEDRRLLAATPELLATNPSGLGSSISNFVESNDTLFFFASDQAHGKELWKTAGTESSTVLVKDIAPGSLDSQPLFSFNQQAQEIVDVNGTLYFLADDGTHGSELWKSDGTESGTVLVKDIRPGAASSNSGLLLNANGTLYFLADDGVHGAELWKSEIGRHGAGHGTCS